VFQASDFPDLLVGLDSPDDAAVWKLDGERALVATTDFFTPVVDDPYDYGTIAAANSLSDIYAMGAQPFLALNIAALPTDLPEEVTEAIFRGGAEKVREAGAVIAGGHSIQDREPKYGLVALGMAGLPHLMTKRGACVDDILVLTKPLGTGVTTTALRAGHATPNDVREATEWMAQLNRQASGLGVSFGVRAATDITGFGLLGHTIELAEASGVGVEYYFGAIPWFSGARRYAESGYFPGGSSDNQRFFGNRVEFDIELDEVSRMLLFDAQTSGGLLLCVPPKDLTAFLREASGIGLSVWPVGRVRARGGVRVHKTIPAGFPAADA
jgi:selenide,water dikinase